MVENLVLDGMYEHYKGMRYRVIALVKHSETLETLVYYECQYENPLGKLWVRPYEMFCETVEVNGKTVPRFKFLGKS